MTDTWRPLKPFHRQGYPSVNLSRGGEKTACKVHRLVLESFVGPCPPGQVACHWDGDRTNNRLENLRWDTQRANADDTLRHGRRRFGPPPNTKLSPQDVLSIRRLRRRGESIADLAGGFEATTHNIRAIISRRIWRHVLDEESPLDVEAPSLVGGSASGPGAA